MIGAIKKAEQRLQTSKPLMLHQFENPANPASPPAPPGNLARYRRSSGFFVDGVGTAAKLTGVARCRQAAQTRGAIVAVEPKGCRLLYGGKTGPHNCRASGPASFRRPEIPN
jgi:cysteine synthase